MVAIIFGSCSPNKKEEDIKITIDYPQSYRYEIDKELYTVFFLSKPALHIKFSLTKVELTKIKTKYYDLGIDNIADDTNFKDDCMIMPKLKTILTVKSESAIQRIEIDEDCDDFYVSNFLKANKVKEYLKIIREILKAKPEIKNAPMSDIMYM